MADTIVWGSGLSCGAALTWVRAAHGDFDATCPKCSTRWSRFTAPPPTCPAPDGGFPTANHGDTVVGFIGSDRTGVTADGRARLTVRTFQPAAFRAEAVSQQPGAAPAPSLVQCAFTVRCSLSDLHHGKHLVAGVFVSDQPTAGPPSAPAALPKEEVAPDLPCVHGRRGLCPHCFLAPVPLPEEQLSKEGGGARIIWCLCGQIQLFDAEESTPHDGATHTRTGCNTSDKPTAGPPEGPAAAPTGSDEPPGYVVTETLRGVRGSHLPELPPAAAPAPGDAEAALRLLVKLDRLNDTASREHTVMGFAARVRSEERERGEAELAAFAAREAKASDQAKEMIRRRQVALDLIDVALTDKSMTPGARVAAAWSVVDAVLRPRASDATSAGVPPEVPHG